MNILSNILLSISSILLLGGGLYFSCKLGFPQLKWKKLFNKKILSTNLGISPFDSLMLSLAARIGVGSIAGIALAIYIGGPGTIFWIWIIGIITSINAFCESYLGSKYQEKGNQDYKGGPSYYIKKGIGSSRLAKIYALLVILAYIVGFMTIQANTIVISLSTYFKLNKVYIAVFIAIVSFISIIKGINRIVNITGKLVPIMGISYLLLGLLILFKNINLVPYIIYTIIKSAWNMKSFTTSFLPAFIIGIKRGTFSTEAGLGTGAIASSTTYTRDKLNLGLIQIIGIYFTTFIICTITALIILTSNYQIFITDSINGIELMQYALNYHLGTCGNIVLMIAIIFLAYSTIIVGYYYGESSLRYLCDDKTIVFLLKILTVYLLFVGGNMNASILWNIVDILVEVLAIINMYSLLKLRREIIFDYQKSK